MFSVHKCVNSYYDILLQNTFRFNNYKLDSLVDLKTICLKNNQDNNFIKLKIE